MSYCSNYNFITEPYVAGGATSALKFIQLLDVPHVYTGQAGKMPIVNPAENALIFTTPFSNALTSAYIFVGNGSNVATGVAMSGDATIDNTGKLTLGNSGVVANTYGDATHVAQITVDAKGRVTAVSNVLITGSGGLTTDLWFALTGSYASTTSFTFTGTAAQAKQIEGSLLTCTDSTGATRRIGYIKSAVESGGTVTCTVVTNSDLASGDKDFKVTPHRKVFDYVHYITIPGELVADASNSQGMFYKTKNNNNKNYYLLPVDAYVRTAAAGTGAACAFNIYAGATNLFTSAVDLTTNSELMENRPNTISIDDDTIVSLRLTSVGGATTKPADFQARLYILPQELYTAF